ncbi:ABC transporter substrate-binding protein [Pararhizobium sp.]|uniref:ABC transporter substrate-binding protein n=1 Tax=Pararhizobium sp. TaxID=1977563 RepID=UPI00271C8D47|nr:ABC transporter substrate-binding protein [Pararhizobium sp.]MDO9417810.1 ABC transporter substrate-binding protein [Pararhizobium sp.]
MIGQHFARGVPVSFVSGFRLLALACTVLFAALLASTASARELKTIGVLVADLGNPFFEQVGRGVEGAARRLLGPSATVTVRSSGYDLDRQIKQIEQFIQEHTDLLIINAVDTERIGPAVRRARELGVVVVAIDVRASGAQATVTSDNIGAGIMACQYLAHRLGEKGDVLILNGPPVSSVIERVKGCRKALGAFPAIKVLPENKDCGGSLEGGLSCMTEILTKYARIDAIFAINDPTSIGANIAAARAGREEFFIVSIDGSPHGVEVLKEPDTRLAAMVRQDPRQMTETAVALGLELFRGQGVKNADVEIPVSLLTRENVAKYTDWER